MNNYNYKNKNNCDNVKTKTINNNYNTQRENKFNSAKQWIEKNKPCNDMTTSEYYGKYKIDLPDSLSSQQFAKEMVSNEYVKVRRKGSRYWTKM